MEHRTDERLYDIALDTQKQMGVISVETAKQSQMLVSLNEKVAIANSKTSANMLAIDTLNKEVQRMKDEDNIRKGKLLVGAVIATAVGSIAVGIIGSIVRSKLGV